MSEATVLLKEYTPAEGNKPHKFKDGNETEYTTFKDAIANPAKDLLGKQVVIHYSEKQNGNYTNRYLDKIEPAPSGNGDHPPLGTGDYVTGQKPPIEVRRIFASTAWNNASNLASIELRYVTGREVTPALVLEIAQGFADRIFEDLLRKGKALTDEDIPFG